MGKWRPRNVPTTDTWRTCTVYQIVVPHNQSKRQDVLNMAYETVLAGYLGIKAYQKVLNYFYWPQLC